MRGEEVLVPIIFFLFLGGVIISGMMARHRERMEMIQKGLSSEEIKALYTREIKRNPLSSLKWGLLFVLGGIALLLGNFLHTQYNADEGVVIGLVILFVGIGLVLFYTLAVKKQNLP